MPIDYQRWAADNRPRLLPMVDLVELDQALLDDSGRLRLLPAAELLAFGLPRLQSWAVARARYQLVTLELIEWLRAAIGGRSAIEVAAGMGDVGYHLGIRMTDSHIQVRNRLVRAHCAATGQAPTNPPRDVERIDANSAVRLYKPEVVIACWLTQFGSQAVPESNSWGAEEREFLSTAEYIHVGNLGVHSRKRILEIPHRVFNPPGLVSRAARQEKNVIFVWGRPHVS